MKTVDTQKPLFYEIPIYKVTLVKESTQTAETPTISAPEDAIRILSDFLSGADREHFVVMLLSTKHQIIGINTVSIGSLNSSVVHPRETFKPAIVSNAAAIILAHNHPSGDPTPSSEDIAITKRLKDAGQVLGIDVLDHVILGEGRFVSLKEYSLI